MKAGFIKSEQIKQNPIIDVNFTHSLCIGQTGSGKTTSFIYPNLKQRINLGHGILFFDIKGNEHKSVKKIANDLNRLDDVIEIGKPWGRDINIIDTFNTRTFLTLLESVIGDPKEGGQNTYFFTAGIELGFNLYSVFKILKIIAQEIEEIGGFVEPDLNKLLKDYSSFSLFEIYKVSINVDSLYDFIQVIKEFNILIEQYVQRNILLYKSQHQNKFKNITLNNHSLESKISFLKKYDVNSEDRAYREKFDSSLVSVIHTLHSGFSFMMTPAAKYISAKNEALSIVKSLLDGKIVIINVRVIPDVIHEVMLKELFEKLIDLNLSSKNDRQPISIFIDEAQRLVNKDIPLDVLRSSQVDVVLAVQSELQFLAKFSKKELWQQISANIADKISFKSTPFNNDDSMNTFIIKNTALLKPFEYIYQYDSDIKLADPIFLTEEELDLVEYKYQSKVLKLKNLNENEIYKYDVTHFESEREIILYDIATKQKRYKKIFSLDQDEIIHGLLKNYLPISLDKLIEQNKQHVSLKKSSWKKLYDLGIVNSNLFNTMYYGVYNAWYEVIEVFYNFDYSPIYPDIDKLLNDPVTNLPKFLSGDLINEALTTRIKKTILEDDQFLIFEEKGKIALFKIYGKFSNSDYDHYPDNFTSDSDSDSFFDEFGEAVF